MASVTFTANLQRHVPCPPCEVGGSTLREALSLALGLYPGLAGYVLDEHGAMRPNMIAFVDGHPAADPRGLSDPVGEGSAIFIMQALSGG